MHGMLKVEYSNYRRELNHPHFCTIRDGDVCTYIFRILYVEELDA